MNSPVGRLWLEATVVGISGVYWKRLKAPSQRSPKDVAAQLRILKKAVRQLDEYFKGRRKKFDVPMDAVGSPFQMKVWDELKKIPHGRTCSYGQIARRLQNPRAARAVGSAVGENPLCILVPCHRVIASDGTLGGFSGGLARKKKLLFLESASDSPLR